MEKIQNSSKSNSGKKAIQAIGGVGMIIALSKVIGFIREMILARAFGDSLEANAYSQAWTIMTYMTFFFSTAISAAFIPMYTHMRMKRGWDAANRYANYILNIYIIIAVFVSIAAYIFAPWIARIMYHGDELERGRALVTQLLRYMIPFLVFFATTGVLCNICNANERFIPEQLQGIALSACTIVVLIVMPENIQWLALASGGAGLIYLLLTLPFLRNIFRYKLQLGINNKAVHQTFITALPSLLSLSFDEFNGGFSKAIASVYNASAAQGRAYQLMMMVQGIIVVPITTIMYPRLSQFVAADNKKGLLKIIKQCIEIMALVLLPIIAIFIVLRLEIIGILYQGNRFTAQDTIELAWPCVFYMVGVFGFGLRNFFTRVFFSLRKNRIPMIIGFITVGIDVGLTFLLSHFWQLSGITIATSIAGGAGAVIMLIVLRKILGPMGLKRVGIEVLKILIAAIIAFIVAYLLHRFVLFSAQNMLQRIIVVLCCGLGGFIAYGISVYLLRVRSMQMLFKMLRSRKNPA